MTGLLERELVDLSDLPAWEDIVACSSRSTHDCTMVAIYRSTVSFPCPDPIRTVFWCEARYQRYLVWSRHDLNCLHCQRHVKVCWQVRAL